MMTQISKNNIDLCLSSYDYHLPKHLIAHRPSERRDHSRLLVYDEKTEEITHARFYELADYLPHESLLVLNQSKVFPCRLLGKKKSGGKVEVFLLSLDSREYGHHCLIKTTSKKRLGEKYYFDCGIVGELSEIGRDGTFCIYFNKNVLEVIDSIGKIPIPPYIRGGESDSSDYSDYQTTYAKNLGSVAAPTAGLHFTPEVFNDLRKKNIERAYVTLHVGMGTFSPVKDENILDHRMHEEKFFIDKEELEKIKNHPRKFCVGTTSLRVLESIQNKEIFPAQSYSTNIFLHPGVEVQSIQGLITNFHLPKSSLMMLVSSLIGRERALDIYQLAIKEEYRFFSYGDAMLIIRK